MVGPYLVCRRKEVIWRLTLCGALFCTQ